MGSQDVVVVISRIFYGCHHFQTAGVFLNTYDSIVLYVFYTCSLNKDVYLRFGNEEEIENDKPTFLNASLRFPVTPKFYHMRLCSLLHSSSDSGNNLTNSVDQKKSEIKSPPSQDAYEQNMQNRFPFRYSIVIITSFSLNYSLGLYSSVYLPVYSITLICVYSNIITQLKPKFIEDLNSQQQ